MTDQEYYLLEQLLGKLQLEVGSPICIACPVIQDGYQIGVYEGKSGELTKSEASYDIKTTVAKLKGQQVDKTNA